MAQVPPPPTYEWPAPPPKKSNTTLVWIIVGVVAVGSCLLLAVFAAILFPVFSQAKLAAQTTTCLSNMKQLALSQLMYSADYDDRFAPGAKWMDLGAKASGAPQDFRCPQAIKDDGPEAYGYGFNSGIAKKKPADISDPARTILLFESAVSSRNVVGTEGDEKRPGRHRGANNYAYADGHVKKVRDPSEPGDFANVVGIWKP